MNESRSYTTKMWAIPRNSLKPTGLHSGFSGAPPALRLLFYRSSLRDVVDDDQADPEVAEWVRPSAESEFCLGAAKVAILVWCWVPSMSTSALGRGSSAISQHLRATKEILQGVVFGARCVWISGTRHAG
jgi:hypothetical protein